MIIDTIDRGVIYQQLEDGGCLILVTESKTCGCGRAAMILVNRDGRTRCVECDHDYKTNKVIQTDS